MKFMAVVKTKDIVATLPPQTFIPLLEATIAYTEKNKQAGKLLALYSMVGWNRGVAIYEQDSLESLQKYIMELPISMFMDWELYPLTDHMEDMKALLTYMKAMAGPPQ